MTIHPSNDEPLRILDFPRDLKRERLPMVVLLWVAIALTVIEYCFLPGSFLKWFPETGQSIAPGMVARTWKQGMSAPWWGVLAPFAWWTGGMLLLWVAVPAGIARAFGLRLREQGLTAKGLLPKLWMYGLMYLVVMIGVAWASTQENFTGMYPMLKPRWCETWTWTLLLVWWGVYAVQFFCVEFFFRGWMLFTLEKRMGMAAIAVMVVPYCMIHYHKPMPEALGAIVAGTVLGWMALKTRGIWGGWLVHAAIAISMDIASLLKSDGLPSQFGP